MTPQTPGKRAGRVFMVLAWCAALFLATRFFGQWEERQQNPNVVVSSEQGEGFIEVKLASNTQGNHTPGRPGNVAPMRSSVAACNNQNSDHAMRSATSARPL